MWTFDEIEKINPPEAKQRQSILSHLLSTGSTWANLLCDTANQLEELGPPFVCCFAQLPFPVLVEEAKYEVPIRTGNATFELDFRPFKIEIEETGKIALLELSIREAQSYKRSAIGTQVRGIIQLWGRRVLYYENYISSLGSDGLSDQIINPVKNRLYSGQVINSRTFEGNIAQRLEPDFVYAINRFLTNYSIVALQQVPELSRVCSFFVMPAPGRVAYRAIPIPVSSVMLRSSIGAPRAPISKARINGAMRFSSRDIDKYLHQLLSMHELANKGEPELALIGCVTAIEWYLNTFVPKRKENWQSAIKICLKQSPLNQLPEDLKQELVGIAEKRNDLAHGQPRDRSKGGEGPEAEIGVSKIVEIGLTLYRELNIRNIQRAVIEH